jgi:hypothetical protein
MSERPNENGEELPPRLLAAYADGEVTPEERARIEAWLTDHPEAAAEVDAQRSLARLYEETPPPAPSEEEWRDVLAAACVLLTVALWSPLPTTPTTQPQKTGPVVVVDDPLVIASGEDIRIESMNDADRAALIVGDPPVRAPLLELLGPDEVKVTKVEPTDDGHMGSLWPTGGAGTPMIVMPLSASEKGP